MEMERVRRNKREEKNGPTEVSWRFLICSTLAFALPQCTSF
jgi:hypothetical protein